MEVERESLLLEVSSLHTRASKDKEDMAEDYRGLLDLIFAYGYGCCAFKNNICGDRPDILDGMPDSSNRLPPEFFDNPRCPPVLMVDKTINAKASQGEATGDSERVTLLRNRPPFPFFCISFGYVWTTLQVCRFGHT